METMGNPKYRCSCGGLKMLEVEVTGKKKLTDRVQIKVEDVKDNMKVINCHCKDCGILYHYKTGD